jgi:hypothetical protein
MAEKARISMMMMSVVFHGEQMTHYNHDYDLELEKLLPILYCILVRRESSPQIIGGMMIRSTITNTQSKAFYEVTTDLLASSTPLKHLAGETLRFRPARIRYEGNNPLTEKECLRVFAEQFYKFNTPAGNA